MIIKFTVLGNLPRKSNSRRIFRNKYSGRILCIKSSKALDYEQSFLVQTLNIPKETFLKTDNLALTAIIFYSSRKPDLSDELLCDLLEKTRIIHNDRQIVVKHLTKYIDSANPRCEVELRKTE